MIYLVTSPSKLPLEYESNTLLEQNTGWKESFGIVDSSVQISDTMATADVSMLETECIL